MLHTKALRIIDCKAHDRATDECLEYMYGLLPPKRRRREHHCAIMYRLSKNHGKLDTYRPDINLRSRKNIKFRRHRGNLKGIDKSTMLRGIKL